MFEYYYLLTTNDGAEIDVIAGQSGFLPKWTGGSVSTEKIKQDTILAQPSGRPREVPPHLQDPSWPPACVSIDTPFERSCRLTGLLSRPYRTLALMRTLPSA
jgi:hypothetical protein